MPRQKAHKSSIFCATRHTSSVAVKIIICLQLSKFCSIQFTWIGLLSHYGHSLKMIGYRAWELKAPDPVEARLSCKQSYSM